MDLLKKPIYPVEPFTITEMEFRKENNYRNETTFALSNGYIGTRGTFEESYPFGTDDGLEGNFINGFYESEHIRYGEWNYGFPTESQSLLNLPNAKGIRLYLDGECFDMNEGTVSDYRRTLHMDKGEVTRDLIWESPLGHRIRIHTRRLVSFTHKNRMELHYEAASLNWSGTMMLESILDGNVENHTRVTNPLVDYGPFGRRLIQEELVAGKETFLAREKVLAGEGTGKEDTAKGEGCPSDWLYYEGTTMHSHLTMACGCSHRFTKNGKNVNFLQKENGFLQKEKHLLQKGDSLENSTEFEVKDYQACVRYRLQVSEGETIALDKFIVYTSSLDLPRTSLKAKVKQELADAAGEGFESEEAQQIAYMKQFWERADVQIDGDEQLQQGIRFNLFHIMQAAGRDGRTGMGAKGLSGEGYEGHYFWDTEMYVVPVLIYSDPSLAKSLLDYRYQTLEEARTRARMLGHRKGALYPWRTINGTEASTYYPLGTAQYHINADIAYAFALYVKVTGDYEYLKEKAAEVLCETARVWADVGCFAESRDGQYCICSVTGPDEYNAIVDNNFYTNLMARENLRDALWALSILKEQEPKVYEDLIVRLGLQEEETKQWQQVMDHMYFPYDEKRQIYPLDDGFMQRKPWDDSQIPEEKRHLLYENYHPLFIFRQRMSKQADAILGMYLHSNYFTEEELRRNYDFYQEVTLHHSSLSTCIFGIVACQIGYYEEAYNYFAQSARMDLDDYHNNFYAGIHAANMAGTWQAMIHGFAGLRTNAGYLFFQPYLPEQWNGYRFIVGYQGSDVQVSIRKGIADFTLLNEKPVDLTVNQTRIHLNQKGECYHAQLSSNLF